MFKDHMSYIRPLSLDEAYAKKLNDLVVQLKLVLYSGTAFVTSADYGCKKCAGRIKLHQDEKWYCLRCTLQPGATSPRWSQETRERIVEIISQYPELEEAAEDLMPQSKRQRLPSKEMTTTKVAFGARVEEARRALGLTQEQLAAKIVKKDGNRLKGSTISSIEKGHQNPSPSVREQLEQLLNLKGLVEC